MFFWLNSGEDLLDLELSSRDFLRSNIFDSFVTHLTTKSTSNPLA